MKRISRNCVVTGLNVALFLISIVCLGSEIGVATQSSVLCVKIFPKPLLALTVILVVISIAGFMGSCCRISWLMYFHLVVMLVLILVLFGFTIFASTAINKAAEHPISNRGYLQRKIIGNWNKIRSCLQKGNMCGVLSNTTLKLSPFESGCCKPPTECQFEYVNATAWHKPAVINSRNQDCTTWTDENLCLDCQCCKAAVLGYSKASWKSEITSGIFLLICLIVVFSLGCYAVRKNRKEGVYLGTGNP